MKTIVSHPEIIAKLKKALGPINSCGVQTFNLCNVISCGSVPNFRKTGKYKLPCGRVVDKKGVSVRYKFCEYGPEDVDFLLYAGIITEDTESVFYAFDDFMMRYRMPSFVESRSFVKTAFCS